MIKDTKGITLVALVITVIVLLILTGAIVSISLSGDGLFSKADSAVEKWNNSTKEEEISIREILLYSNKKEVSGNVATFSDGARDLSIDNITVTIEPEQEGSGEPSPENVRPIKGWTEAKIYHSGENMDDYETFNISFPEEAGTVYGGTLDVTNGTLTVTGIKYVLNSETGWKMVGRRSGVSGVYFYVDFTTPSLLCKLNASQIAISYKVEKYTHGKIENPWSEVGNNAWIFAPNDDKTTLRVSFDDNMNIDSVEKLKEWIDSQDEVAIYYPIKNPITYNVTQHQLSILLGTNNIWSDTGDTSVIYKAEED